MTTKLGLVLLSSTSNAAGSTTRSRLDLTATSPPAEGGLIVGRLVNASTGPTVAPVLRIMAARKQGSMPAAGAAGTGDDDWKVLFTLPGNTVASSELLFSYRFGPEIAYLQIEVTGNTGQAVTAEAIVHAYG